MLERVAELRAGGSMQTVVILSSNTEGYLENGVLKPALASEFMSIPMTYAPNMEAAKHFLGV
jgi:hypothetical protein